jgi:cytochrome c-type biogenesis protein CcmH/NrfG
MGMLYEKRGDQKSAVAALRKSVELSPDDPDYRRALAAAEARTTSP